MCGIAGVYKLSGGVTRDEVAAVSNMTDALLRRGPDGGGVYEGPEAILGNRRLSVIDLSEAGAQPLSNENGRIWITYNGEVYNYADLRRALSECGHHFQSNTDTEVLVHGYEEWGPRGLLDRLRGMFAFAIYDLDKHKIFLARDRFGIKPLFYSLWQDRFVFASEVRAIRKSNLVPDEDDPDAYLLFLLFGSIPAPWTTYRSIRGLSPGHYIIADRSGVRIEKYYELLSLFQDQPSDGSHVDSAEHLLSEIREGLRQAVQGHLVSDAPLGAFLSGGVDSTAIVALSVMDRADLVTLSVVFGEGGYSEEPFQKLVAGRFKTTHHRVPVTVRDFHDQLERFIDAMDLPTVDGLNTYFVARAAKEIGLKVVLSGLGGDEIFAGYGTVKRAVTLARLRSMPVPLRAPILSAAGALRGYNKLGFLNRDGIVPFYLIQRGLFTPGEAARLADTTESHAWNVIASAEPERIPESPGLTQQFLEAKHYLADQLLRDSDVFGMANSIEIRVPFLDHKLVNTVCGVRPRLTDLNGLPKPMLTGALKDILPGDIVTRRKQGFGLPMDPWLRQSDSLFRHTGSRLNRKEYESVWQNFLRGRTHWSRPWALTVLARAS
jgi:asparagine synthase (glutamine-hydrolysing)